MIEASDGEELLEMVRIHRPALIIADFMMPKIDGLECRKRLIQTEALSKIPMILCTAVDTREVIELGQKVGVREFIFKPFTKNRLLLTVTKCLKPDQKESPNGD